MTVSERCQNPLVAPWNPGGNYYSAFFPLYYYSTISVDTVPEKIFVGILKSLVLGTSGYVINLIEKHPDGRNLRVWIQNSTFTVPSSGPALQAALAAFTATSGVSMGRDANTNPGTETPGNQGTLLPRDAQSH